MPGLQSFCVCTAIALGCIYILQVSWFVAWLVLDEKRILSRRNGLIPCISHKDKNSKSGDKVDVSAKVVEIFSKLLPSRIYQVCVNEKLD